MLLDIIPVPVVIICTIVIIPVSIAMKGGLFRRKSFNTIRHNESHALRKFFPAFCFDAENARKYYENNKNDQETRSTKNQPNWNINRFAEAVTRNIFFRYKKLCRLMTSYTVIKFSNTIPFEAEP